VNPTHAARSSDTESAIAYLGIGSNTGESRGHVENAISEIGALPLTQVRRVSPLYGSRPWGNTRQPNFVNAVVEIITSLGPRRLLEAIKSIERSHGRVPGERWGPRPLDIDILLYDDYAVVEQDLQVPHLRMWDRAFVLLPLADLRPDLAGPGGLTVKERLKEIATIGQEVWPLE
jgi:2-amino-4-hydroxy-6-hydroxymethyldihydropteridine diphosphokinase